MPIQNQDGLYSALERALQQSKRPMDCHELFDMPDVNKHAASANRVSDYLGNLWRKGHLTRLAAGGGSRARWLYQWKPQKERTISQKLPAIPPDEERMLLRRPHVTVHEKDGVVTLELPHIVITITPRS